MKFDWCSSFREDVVSSWPTIASPPGGNFYVGEPDTPPRTLVIFYPPRDSNLSGSPWGAGEIVMYLGPVNGYPKTGAFVGSDGAVRWGYPLANFRVVPQGELL